MVIKMKMKEKKKKKLQWVEKREYKESKVRWNNEDDVDLSTEEFMRKHEGLIRDMVYSRLRPMGLTYTSQYHDDMLSDANLNVLITDRKWDKDMEGGRNRKQWMKYCLTQQLTKSANKIRKALMREEGLWEEREEFMEYSGSVSEGMPSLVSKFISSLDEEQADILSSRVYDGESLGSIAKRLRKRKEYIVKEYQYLQEDFKDFLDDKCSSEEESVII